MIGFMFACLESASTHSSLGHVKDQTLLDQVLHLNIFCRNLINLSTYGLNYEYDQKSDAS